MAQRNPRDSEWLRTEIILSDDEIPLRTRLIVRQQILRLAWPPRSVSGEQDVVEISALRFRKELRVEPIVVSKGGPKFRTKDPASLRDQATDPLDVVREPLRG